MLCQSGELTTKLMMTDSDLIAAILEAGQDRVPTDVDIQNIINQ